MALLTLSKAFTCLKCAGRRFVFDCRTLAVCSAARQCATRPAAECRPSARSTRCRWWWWPWAITCSSWSTTSRSCCGRWWAPPWPVSSGGGGYTPWSALVEVGTLRGQFWWMWVHSVVSSGGKGTLRGQLWWRWVHSVVSSGGGGYTLWSALVELGTLLVFFCILRPINYIWLYWPGVMELRDMYV